MSASQSHSATGISARGIRTATNQASFCASGSERNASNNAAMSCAWVKTMNPIAKTKTTTPIPINLAMQHFTHPTNAPAFGTTGAGFAQGRGSTFHARNARVMTVLRHARLALFALLSITLLVTDRHPARGQTPAPAAAKPAAASCQRAAFRVVVDVGH